MCGRYFVEISVDELKEIVEAADKENTAREQSRQYSFTFKGGEIFPGSIAPVITANRAVQYMKWGFPSAIANKTPHINARSETAKASKTFSEAMAARRCIIPASAFYEWKTSETPARRGKAKRKVKYEITLPDRAILYMAGIYSTGPEVSSRGEDGRYAILTREATPEISEIHNRMPVILPKSLIHVWLTETPEVIKDALTDLQFAPASASDKQPEQLRLQFDD